MRWIRAGVPSLIATAAAMGLMFWARDAYQVRILPERLMEWLLLFVPLDAFAQGIQDFGPRAKVFALYGSIAGMSAALFGLGLVAPRFRWPGTGILGLGLALFIVAMAGIMPLTGAGLFASDLSQHPILVNGVYLGMALAYTAILLAGQAVTDAIGAPAEGGISFTRRYALFASAIGAIGAYALAIRQAATGGGTVVSDLPVAELPPNLALPPVPTPTTHPGMATVEATLPPALKAQATATSVPAAATVAQQATATSGAAAVASPVIPPTVAAIAQATVAPTRQSAVPPPPTAAPPTPTLFEGPFPTPEAARKVVRDKDGALTAAIRVKGELPALVTSNDAFYVVAKNAVADPVLDANKWRMVLDGEVNRPVQLDYRLLRRLPAVEVHKTLECISNFTAQCDLAFFGCDLISTARWRGARVRDVLQLAGGLKSGVVSLEVRSSDEYSSSVPPDLALDPDSLLVYEMNGATLPRAHGYPARLLVPGRYGMKNAKWVVGIRARSDEYVDWYGQRGWSRTGFVRTMSRIDVPADKATIAPGRHRIAGIAYAGDRSIAGVEFSSDAGQSWHPTVFLDPPLGRDTWVRWQAEFDIAAGQTVTLISRAIDGTGEVQTEEFNLPQPNGGSGRHSIQVNAG
ncbi:MAG: hypothetical protein CL878_09950 [Dehalococcoidia bacterium]|nr:hypothetical protein [Dehalococcoidia bacterium]